MSRSTGLGLAVLSAISFGLSGPFGKALIDAGWSSNGALLVRVGGSTVVLLAILAVTRPGVLASIRRDGARMVLYGAFAIAGAQGSYFNAVRYLPVPIALLLEYTGPILVIGWVWLVRRQPPTGRTLAGGAIALVGLTMVVQVWTGGGLAWQGLVWGFSAAVCQSVYFLLPDLSASGNGDSPGTPPLVLAGLGMAIGTVLITLLGLFGVLPVVISTDVTSVVLAGFNVGWVFTAAFLVLVPTVLAYTAGIAAIGQIGSARASLIGLLEVVTAAVAAWLLLGETPTPIQAVGGALILAGVALTTPSPGAEPAEPLPMLGETTRE
ncbi:EamA family transporter [Pseudonocardia spinosispora]|uniref:EamA family transporter n=1 Tax=Pseudonocardia spinosispora TaxID=103441 RepID=UPI000490EFD5|nr:DMT family transporter [Pseudonocardia spinosispora]